VSLEQCLVLWLQRLNTPCLPWPRGQGIHTSFSLSLFRKRASCITHTESGTLNNLVSVRLTFMLVRHALPSQGLRLFRVLGTSWNPIHRPSLTILIEAMPPSPNLARFISFLARQVGYFSYRAQATRKTLDDFRFDSIG
jgi:hypothetical protein